jgi:hypothetical protein
MKTIRTLLFGAIIAISGLSVNAQSISFPAASPAASVSQTFGLTKIEIIYSAPAVRGRKIWDSLVPYDSVWRTGANAATTISFSTDVMLDGQKIKKGKYALFTIPGKSSWMIILNSDADQFGAFTYKESMDAIRFSVTPQSADMKERMTFTIDATSDSVGTVSLCWERLKVSFDVMADTKGMIKKGITDFTDNVWRSYANSANYYVDNNLDLKKAQDWAQQSVNMKEHFFNRYVLAKVYQAEKNRTMALKYAKEAKAIGDKVNDEFYQNYKGKVASLIAECGGGKK